MGITISIVWSVFGIDCNILLEKPGMLKKDLAHLYADPPATEYFQLLLSLIFYTVIKHVLNQDLLLLFSHYFYKLTLIWEDKFNVKTYSNYLGHDKINKFQGHTATLYICWLNVTCRNHKFYRR